MRVLIAAVSALVLGVAVVVSPAPDERNTAEGPHRQWIKVVFGLDEQPAAWDGRLTVHNGRPLQLSGWALEERDSVDPEAHTWKMTTDRPEGRRFTYLEPFRGLLLELEFTRETRIDFETGQGIFRVSPAELVPGRPIEYLQGRASVELLGDGRRVAETETDDDFAAIAVDERGHRHVLWIAYDTTADVSQLLIRDVDDPASGPEPISAAREFASPQLFVNPDGALHAVWCSPADTGNWDVYETTRSSRGWTTNRLTTAEGSDFHLAADQSDDGTLWMVWQSFRDQSGDIYAKCLKNGRWSDDIPVAAVEANCWQPSVSVDGQGKAWIGYDSYENGNYDVFLTSLDWDGENARHGPRIAVAQSPDFEAHASVLADDAGQVWVAYDAAGPNWGKDFRDRETLAGGTYAEPLHASRRLELRCVVDNVVHQTVVPLPQLRPPDRLHVIARGGDSPVKRFYELPHLARDGDGRMWLLFRLCRQGYCPHPPMGIDWRICATTLTDRGWLEPIELPMSQGRQNQRVSCAVGPDGRLVCAWAEGNRFASVNRKYSVYAGSLPVIRERAAEVEVEPVPVDPPDGSDAPPNPPATLVRNGETYRLYFGDLHRHTNISRCSPTLDGCLTDAHRYALDAVKLDFLAVTDHTRDVDPFSWWRTQQAADLYHIPNRYVPIYAYERSNHTENGGHRNVFMLERGWDVSRSDHWYSGRRGVSQQDASPDTTLYPWLKQKPGALTAAHTPAYSTDKMRGTWTFNDPQVEPVAEIFQGFRQSYERPGDNVADEASLWYALKKGYRLGFIASSDHISTHTSYACVWAAEKTREAIFEAIQSRRTYAATDRILLDVRIGDALMGEETVLAGDRVNLSIRADGTAPIREIQIVRNGKVLGQIAPDRAQVDERFVDADPMPGNSYYYARVTQHDGGLAWGSPIWVRRE